MGDTPIELLSRYGKSSFRSQIASQEFIATAGQTVFNITNGSYTKNTNSLFINVDGKVIPFSKFTETSPTSFTLDVGASEGVTVFAYWYISVGTISINEIESARNSLIKSVNYPLLDDRLESIETDVVASMFRFGTNYAYYSKLGSVDAFVSALSTYDTIIIDIDMNLDREITLKDINIFQINNSIINYINSTAQIIINENVAFYVNNIVNTISGHNKGCIKAISTESGNMRGTVISVKLFDGNTSNNDVDKAILLSIGTYGMHNLKLINLQLNNFNYGVYVDVSTGDSSISISCNVFENIFGLGTVQLIYFSDGNQINCFNNILRNIVVNKSIATHYNVPAINDKYNNIHDNIMFINYGAPLGSAGRPHIYVAPRVSHNSRTYPEYLFSTKEWALIGCFNDSSDSFLRTEDCYAIYQILDGTDIVANIKLTRSSGYAVTATIETFNNFNIPAPSIGSFSVYASYNDGSSDHFNVWIQNTATSSDYKLRFVDSYGYTPYPDGFLMCTDLERGSSFLIGGTKVYIPNYSTTATFSNSWTGSLKESFNSGKLSIVGSLTPGVNTVGTVIASSAYRAPYLYDYVVRATNSATLVSVDAFVIRASTGNIEVLASGLSGTYVFNISYACSY